MRKLPLFSFLSSSGGCQSLRTTSLNRGDNHRLNETSTCSVVWPSAQNRVCRQRKLCRSAHYTAGRQSIPAEPATHRNKGQNKAWQHISRHVCITHVSYHCDDSKGHMPRFLDHQSCISMHGGPKNRVCILDFKCMHTNQTNKAQFLSPIHGTRHACKMQCNLGIQAKESNMTWQLTHASIQACIWQCKLMARLTYT